MIEIRSFRDLLRLFFIFRQEFKWAVVTTVIIAVLGAFLLPPSYESNARLLVKPGRNNATLPIEMDNRQTLVAPSTQRDPIVDEEKMLTGRSVVEKVAQRAMDEMVSSKPEGFWETIKHYIKLGTKAVIDAIRAVLQALGIVEPKTGLQRLAKELEKSFEAGHEQGSAVIDVRLTWEDPAIAQQLLRIWLEVYMDERARTLGRESLQAFYETEIETVADRIRSLKNNLQERLKEIDSIDVNKRLTSLSEQIDTVAENKNDAVNRVAGLERFLVSAQAALKSAPKELVASREIALNPTQLDLKQQLNDLKIERAQLLRTYTENAPSIGIIDQNITSVEALIDAQQERLESTRTVDRNVLINDIEKQIINAKLEKNQLEGQIKAYEKSLSSLRETRDRVMAREPELSRLRLELTSSERSFALYSENLEKARIDQALDTSRISNIALIEPATFNPSRVFPKSLMILLMSLPAGIAVGLLTIYICYLLDQRIHDGGRAEKTFGVPLWSSLPDLSQDKDNLTALTAGIYRLYGSLPHSKINSEGLTLAFTSPSKGAGVSFVVAKLSELLEEKGYGVSTKVDSVPQAGNVVVLDASSVQTNPDAFIILQKADRIALVVEAKKTTVPVVENALGLLRTAFETVDGIVLNRRRFEVPGHVLKIVSRMRSSG